MSDCGTLDIQPADGNGGGNGDQRRQRGVNPTLLMAGVSTVGWGAVLVAKNKG